MGQLEVNRHVPTEEAAALLELTREIAAAELAPVAAEHEYRRRFPRELFRTLGGAGLLGLPYSEAYGGGGQPAQVYLQVIEELARVWLTVAMGVSVHYLACFPLAEFGTDEQRRRWLPDMLGGDLLGAYCLSEPDSGSDAAALSTRAAREGDKYVVHGVKAWISHAGLADFYSAFVRTGDPGARGISCLLLPGQGDGLSAAAPEQKMGLRASPTGQLVFSGLRVGADRLLGREGQGFAVALAALDAGRLGIAACAVGLAQSALDVAVDYARTRTQFGRPVMDFQGVSFLLADMATQIEASRGLYLNAARLRDRGAPFSKEAAMAKLFATDAAMRVTTDAVQVLGGYGYVEDYPAERLMREAKALQIVEGTNQIQRVVIARHLRNG